MTSQYGKKKYHPIWQPTNACVANASLPRHDDCQNC